MRISKEMRPLFRYRNKEIRRRVRKLPHLWWSIAIFVLAILLLCVSLFIYKWNNWLSGVLVSASCGCFTGLTFYFLTNIRNNKELKLQKEYTAIKKTYEIITSILKYADYYKFFIISSFPKRNALEDGFEVLSLLDELETARNQIDLSVYDTAKSLRYDPIDLDNVNSYRNKIKESENAESMESTIIWISEQLLPAADTLHELLYERKDQINFIYKHFI